MTIDLVAFLTARLDEDEAAAKFATAGPWVDDLGGPIRGGLDLRFAIAHQAQRWNSQHIARHDPARVLTEVDAKRRTLIRSQEALLAANPMLVHFAQQTLLDLASPHRTHPDYRPEWFA